MLVSTLDSFKLEVEVIICVLSTWLYIICAYMICQNSANFTQQQKKKPMVRTHVCDDKK